MVYVLMSALIFGLVGIPMLRFASEPDQFREWIGQHGAIGRLAYMGMVFIQVVVAIIPGEPLEIAGGYAFSTLEGMSLCLLASGIGSAFVVCLVRRYGTRLVEVFFSREKIRSLRFLQASPKRTLLFFLVFIVPGTPKDLLCYFAGLTSIKLPVLLLICSFGRLPSIITSTLGGDALGNQSYFYAAAIFASTLAVSGLGLLLYDRLCKRSREKYAPPQKLSEIIQETEINQRDNSNSA